MNRRQFIAGAAALALLPKIGLADGGTIEIETGFDADGHLLFGSHPLATSDCFRPALAATCDKAAIANTPFDLVEEIRSALRAEMLVESEQRFLHRVRQIAPLASPTVDGFCDALANHIEGFGANVVIVNPTALTILQSDALSSEFERIERFEAIPLSMYLVGVYCGAAVLVDAYGRADAPVVIGKIAAEPTDRTISIHDDAIWFADGFERDFATIAMPETLTFT